MSLIQLTNDEYFELKSKYRKAKIDEHTQFEIFGQNCLTEYAKHWIKGVEAYRKLKGLKIINEGRLMQHKCKNKGVYSWTSRLANPVLCPRCKCRLKTPTKNDELMKTLKKKSTEV